jgi:hypothetical protein
MTIAAPGPRRIDYSAVQIRVRKVAGSTPVVRSSESPLSCGLSGGVRGAPPYQVTASRAATPTPPPPGGDPAESRRGTHI